jgi:hypothetical protein
MKLPSLICLILFPALIFAQKKSKNGIERNLRDTSAKFNYSWDKKPIRHVIHWNPASTFVLTGVLGYEIKVHKRASILVRGLYGSYSLNSTSFRQACAFVEPRIYVLATAPRGLYVSPYLRYRWFEATDIVTINGITNAQTMKANSYSVGLTLGWQWILGNWFMVNPYIGGAWNYHNIQSSTPNYNDRFYLSSLGFTPVSFRWGVCLGLAFK